MTATTKTPGFKYLDATGADQWVEMEVGGGERNVGLSVGGTFAGTVTMQRRRPDQAVADSKDLFTTTTPAEKIITVIGPCVIRAGIKTGEYTSGTAEIEIG